MYGFDEAVLEFMRDYPLTAYVVRSTGSYNPATASVETSDVQHPVEAILMDYTLQSNGLGVALGTDIKAGDKQLFVRPPLKSNPNATLTDIDPSTDRVIVAGVTYQVIRVKELNPTAVDVILYELQLRR